MHRHLGIFVNRKCCSKFKSLEIWLINKLENVPLKVVIKQYLVIHRLYGAIFLDSVH